ncbi:uncharacterized protein LOC122403155 [Colletes gigas]|uniref:uncharacterized protein LOC122403155 n=1 Tax=Colletes gigas TaxID=935657 RepID=UPI001C9A9510|nr:uncharacterized protein LOC122403155 [Colletes gigas]
MQRFWNLEECPASKILSSEEQACEDHYTKHTTRGPSGRYIVSLPLKHTELRLGDTYNVAYTRFLALERSLDKHADRKAQYRDFLNEYEKLGYMTEIQDERTVGCYLPHHPVVKTDSITTKIRVVFDASARSSSGTSLNDILMVGPTIQDDLFAIIM